MQLAVAWTPAGSMKMQSQSVCWLKMQLPHEPFTHTDSKAVSDRLLFTVNETWSCSRAPPAELQRFKKVPLQRRVEESRKKKMRATTCCVGFDLPKTGCSEFYNNLARFQHRYREGCSVKQFYLLRCHFWNSQPQKANLYPWNKRWKLITSSCLDWRLCQKTRVQSEQRM